VEVQMRSTPVMVGIGLASMAWLASIASAQGFDRSYWLLAKQQSRIWCGYTDPDTFRSATSTVKPTDSVIVTYSLGELKQLTYQVQPASGDWIVVDKYTPSHGRLLLQRVNFLSQRNRRVTQSAVIDGGRAGPLRVVSVSTLQGQPVTATAAADRDDLPNVPVITDPARAPFMLVVTQMRHESVPTLCRKVQ
jgi:hypothetical protein